MTLYIIVLLRPETFFIAKAVPHKVWTRRDNINLDCAFKRGGKKKKNRNRWPQSSYTEIVVNRNRSNEIISSCCVGIISAYRWSAVAIAKSRKTNVHAGNAHPTSTIHIIYYYLLPALSRRSINVPSVCYTDVALLGHRTREEHVSVWVCGCGWVSVREREWERGSVINIRFTLLRHKTRSSVTDWPTDVAFIGTT